MHHFHYAGQKLHCESVDLAAIAQLHGTPTYVYSAQTIADKIATDSPPQKHETTKGTTIS